MFIAALTDYCLHLLMNKENMHLNVFIHICQKRQNIDSPELLYSFSVAMSEVEFQEGEIKFE